MLLCDEEYLRVVVLFPVNQRGEELMMGAPSEVSPRRLGGAAYSGGEGQLKRHCGAWRGFAIPWAANASAFFCCPL
jgi:hypothetical protein